MRYHGHEPLLEDLEDEKLSNEEQSASNITIHDRGNGRYRMKFKGTKRSREDPPKQCLEAWVHLSPRHKRLPSPTT